MSMLIMLCGLPGSGKSHYGKILANKNGWEYVSRDEVRYEFVTDQAHYFDHEKEVYKEFCNRIDMHLLNDKTVIADATHLNKPSRDKLLNTLTSKIDKRILIMMTTPFEVCMKRNSARVGITRVPDSQMYAMKHRFKKPNLVVENFDKILYVNGEE